MKRFIDIGHQMYATDMQPKEFSFYCTVSDSYERFSDEDVWESAADFEKDYLDDGGTDLQRYIGLIPDEFKIAEYKAVTKQEFGEFIKELFLLKLVV
ncbi:hypothetical protein IIC38_16270 [candidate division KSB1 bacterium]|nr:hypothetical protein [candidate division KSB1 bacterium]